MSRPLTNVEKLIVVMIQGKQRMEAKEYTKANDNSLSKDYRRGYSDAHRDWLNTLLEVATEVKCDLSGELQEKT